MRVPIPIKRIDSVFSKTYHLGLVSALGLGYSPFASGTVASILGIPFGFAILQLPLWQSLLICLVLAVISHPSIKKACHHWGLMDDSRIVIDEVIGQGISMLPFRPYIVEAKWPPLYLVMAAFFVFRFMDIFKPYPANYFDRKITAFGVIADDVVAGIYTAIVLQGLILILEK